MRFRAYLDEDIPGPLARALKARGMDVLTTVEAGNTGKTDLQQIEFAISADRVLITCNKKDFAILHREYLALNKKHSGIILVPQENISLLLKSLLKLWSELSKEDMEDRLEFLSNWK